MAESTGIYLANAEDNDLSPFTITEEGSNSLSITTDSALHGSLGYELAFSGNTGENFLYFSKSFSSGSDIFARCYFYIPSSFDMNTSYLSLLYLREISNDLAYVRFYYSSGNLILNRFYYRTNSTWTYTSVSGTISRDILHYIEYRYKSDSIAGEVTLWLDGAQIATVTGLSTDSFQADTIGCGNIMGGVPSAGSKIYIDDIKIDSSYIGAYTESGGGSSLPSIINNHRQQGAM